jgi:hypothetical protein
VSEFAELRTKKKKPNKTEVFSTPSGYNATALAAMQKALHSDN